MTELPRDLLIQTATNAAPKLMERTETELAGSLVKSVGVNAPTVFKASLWRSAFEHIVSTPDEDYFSLIHHRSGGAVRESGSPDATATANSTTAHSMHEQQVWSSDGVVDFAHFYVPTPLVTGVFEQLNERDAAFDDFQFSLGSREPHMVSAMTAAAPMLFGDVAPSRMMLDSWGVIFAETLVRHHTVHGTNQTQQALGALPPVHIQRVIDYIEAHLDADLSLDALAGVAAQNVYHFAKRFRESVGEPPHAYVMRRRVLRAKALLKDGRLPLADIALECGFSGQSHFTTVFGAHTGATPGKYRRAVRG